jgi:3-hydroxybutyryl-CoA dehydrogenase
VSEPQSTSVTVIGGGIMGAGIAYVAALAGHPVQIVEVNAATAEAAQENVDKYASRARSRGDDLGAVEDLVVTTDLEAGVGRATIVVEAIVEDLEVKKALFARIGAAAQPGAMLASNTSGLSIAVLGASAGRPEHTIGLHFFNPVPSMKLVEMIASPDTSEATIQHGRDFCAGLGKETIRVRDLPGFITTRLGVILMAEAIRALEQGVATAQDIDTGMKLGYNHPMGPLELADRIGLDTLLQILENQREAWGDGFRPPPLLRQMVAAGRLGRKNGRGFYDY